MKLYNGDCLDILKTLPSNSVDLIITSPPYAEQRKKAYGGISEIKYIEWFSPIAQQLKRILKPTGSFFLNIKPHTTNGERSLYVFDLISYLKKNIGFKFIDEYCWTKNPFPGGLKGRFKNAFEPVYHLTLSSPAIIKFNPTACGIPIKEESRKRALRKQCGSPKNGSGMTGMNTTNILNLSVGRPSNVIHINNVSNQFTNKQFHPATFPEGLVDFFIKSFSNIGDVVLDPFAGSGTTGLSCQKLQRDFILIENKKEYFDLMYKRLNHAGEKQN